MCKRRAKKGREGEERERETGAEIKGERGEWEGREKRMSSVIGVGVKGERSRRGNNRERKEEVGVGKKRECLRESSCEN